NAFWGRGKTRLGQWGIPACAVCDGALPLFRQKPLVVVGGGDTAVEEATFLTKFGSTVHVVHRRHELRASKIMQHRLLSNPKVNMVWDSVVEEALGDEFLACVRVRNLTTN